MRTTNCIISLLSAMLLMFPLGVTAENSKEFGEYVIHYNAMATDFLPPEVARQYRITRSRNRGMINITVLKKILGSPGQPVHAQVKITAQNLTGQSRRIATREIRDGNAIYYIGEFSVANEETLKFKVQARPQGSHEEVEAEFSQDFYTH
jgi:hypothetical protein